MRRRVAAVTAVLLGSVAAGVGAAALPARANAASVPSVTVRAIDREGKAVAVSVSLTSADTGDVHDTVSSARAGSVAVGVYNAAAWVWEPNKTAATLIDREVTITASQTLTFDARPGKLLRMTVNDSSVAPNDVLVEPFSPTAGAAWWNNSYGPPIDAAVYLVPGALPAGWDLLLQTNLVRHESNYAASPVEYELVKLLSGSIPSSLTFASTRAGLAQEHLTIRSLGPGGDGVSFGPAQFDSGSLGRLPYISLGQSNVVTPANVDLFFSPGYTWESVDYAANDDLYGSGPLLAGHTYAQTFNAAVFSPSPLLGPVVYQNSISLSEVFGNCLLVDAAGQGGQTESVGLYPTAPQGWLYEGSKLIAHASGYNANFRATIPATTQPYTLTMQTTRLTGGNTPLNGIAQSLTATYKFKAAAGDTSINADNFWPRMVPQGVTESNAAAGGSATTVPITFDTTAGAIVAHDVHVWASANGGKTWSPLPLTHNGNTWTVIVHNPKAAGYVSLRVLGEDPLGFTSAVTAINAYAVS